MGMEQKRIKRSTSKKESAETEVEATNSKKDSAQKVKDDTDALLDEIDAVLEENAEEFVRAYVQKGGE